jgi:hypothetical protein
MDCARFGVVRAVYNAFHPRVQERARAHGAWLNCSKEFAVSQTMVTQMRGGLAKGHDLSVGGGVGVSDVAVPASTNNSSLVNDYCAYRYLARF